MRNVTKIIPLLLALLLTNCSYVVSKYPVGLENHSLKSADWNGVWLNEEAIIKIDVIDELKGIIQLAWIEKKQEELKFESMTCQIMKGKKWLYINVLEMTNEDTGDHYFWGKIKKDEKKIIFWLPSVEAFHEAFRAGEIKAEVSKTQKTGTITQRIEDIKLLDEPKTIIDLLEKNGSKFFVWDEPAILIKFNN